jgi:hypothetical protein
MGRFVTFPKPSRTDQKGRRRQVEALEKVEKPPITGSDES